jgi:hypothetical protein
MMLGQFFYAAHRQFTDRLVPRHTLALRLQLLSTCAMRFAQ